MDSLLLRALRCEPTERPPVWLMRQAGRYMPEYRALKESYSFLELCKNSELAAQITHLPLKAFPLDAAIVFADILLILETLGFDIGFGKDHGPLIQGLDLDHHLPKVEEKASIGLSYVGRTIKKLKAELTVPLLGFCGAPFTLATYILEGKGSQHYEKTKQWMYHHSDRLHELLELLTHQTIDYLNMQIESGADAVQIFDSWAMHFAYTELQEFSFPYLQKILTALEKTQTPIILFAKGSCAFLEDYVALNPSCISLDSSADLLKVAPRIPKHIAIQGNLEPDLLFASPDQLKKETLRLLEGMQDRPGFIFNLGHGIKPETPYENVRHLIDTVTSYQAQLI